MDIKFKGPLENICETCNHKNLQIETYELYGDCFVVSQEIEVKCCYERICTYVYNAALEFEKNNHSKL